MKHISVLVISLLLSVICYGQEMTLKDCIATGIAGNLSLANARIDIDKGRTGMSQSRARLLPVIDGIFQFTDYLESPVNVTTGTLLGSEFPENPTWQTIRSTQYNASAGILLSMPLYNQTILAAIDVARTIRDINSLSYEKAVEDLTLQIGKVYYMAQASMEQERLAEVNIMRMEALYGITEALFSQGVVMEVDLNRVHISLQNLRAHHEQCHTLHVQQLNMLRFLMDIDPDIPIEVVEMEERVEPLYESAVCSYLPELRIAEQQKILAEQRVKLVKAGYLPSLSLTGYAGALGYQEKFHHFFHTSAAKDNWFGNCYIGLQVKIPIFGANSKKLQIRQHKYDAMQAVNRMEQLQKQFNENFANATLQLDYNIDVFRTQTESRRQAENVFNVTEEQYKEGVASMTELLQDEMQLRTAQAACVQAYCQCCLARLELLRLSGNLSLLSE